MDGDEIIITKYGVVDIVSTGVDMIANAFQTLRIEQQIVGPDAIEFSVFVDDQLKWSTGTDFSLGAANSDIYLGGFGSEKFAGEIDFIQIEKAGRVTARYDFGDGGMILKDYKYTSGFGIRHVGVITAGDLTQFWQEGQETYTNVCPELDSFDLEIDSEYPDTVRTIANTGHESLRYFVEDNPCPVFNNVIHFHPDLTGDTIKLDSAINFGTTEPIIDGLGMNELFLDGQGATQIFEGTWEYGYLNLKNIQVLNGYHPTNGGLIHVPYDISLFLENVILKGHNSQGNNQWITLTGLTMDDGSSIEIKGEVRIEK